MANNDNLKFNGVISHYDQYNGYKNYAHSVINIFNNYYNSNLTNVDIWNERCFVVALQDTSNRGEELHKRIQGNTIKKAPGNSLALLGLYGILDFDGVVVDVVGAIWKHKELIPAVGRRNPGVKVDLEYIREAYVNRKATYSIDKKYKCVVAPLELISEYLDLIDTMDLDSERTYTDEQVYHKVTHDVRNSKLQKQFRESLIDRDRKCVLCDIQDKGLLIASHIWPVGKLVKDASLKNAQKVYHYTNSENGLLLCPNHDALFDKKYITFDNDGNLVLSRRLEGMEELLNLNTDIVLELSEPMKFYMSKHRDIYQTKNNIE